MKTIQVGDQVGDYRVIDIAGSGGMGTVYKIEHRISKRIEAMKVLPLSSDPDQVQRFEREIRLQARLHHPNIAGLYNAVRHDGSVALIMEFLEGETLQRMIDAGPLPVETAVDIATQVLHALAYAHECGVIHRDVSPANIIITSDRVAKLTDFGLALGATDLRLSTSSAPLGSPWYMSPEQIKGMQELDARTDVYAMGAVLHEMLTGRKLFEEEGAFAVMRAHVEAEPRLPSSLNPGVPPALDEIVRKAVAKDPAMRFLSADEFRQALQTFAVNAGTVRKPSGLRKPWHAAFAWMPSRWRGLRSSPAAILLVLAPAALLAAYGGVRFFGMASRIRIADSKPRAAAPAPHEAAPPPAAIPPVVVAEPKPVEARESSELPVTDSVATAEPRQQATPKPARRASQTRQSSGIRVTGAEPQPAEAMPTTRVPAHAPTVPGPAVSTPNCPTPSGRGTPDAAAESPTPKTMSQESTPAAAQPAGNRFVRALGKVNPFRRLAKRDAKAK